MLKRNLTVIYTAGIGALALASLINVGIAGALAVTGFGLLFYVVISVIAQI